LLCRRRKWQRPERSKLLGRRLGSDGEQHPQYSPGP
jgi:hypothetical protein